MGINPGSLVSGSDKEIKTYENKIKSQFVTSSFENTLISHPQSWRVYWVTRGALRGAKLPSRVAEIYGQQEAQEILLGRLETHRLRCYE